LTPPGLTPTLTVIPTVGSTLMLPLGLVPAPTVTSALTPEPSPRPTRTPTP